MNKPSRFLGLAVFASVILTTSSACFAQAPATATALAPPTDGPAATLTFAGAKTLQVRSHDRKFPLIGLNPRETVSVNVQFPATLAAQPLVVQSLDGAAISLSSQSPSLGADGSFSLNLAAGAQPGRYRVFVAAGGVSTELQFWVPTPSPSDNPQFLTH